MVNKMELEPSAPNYEIFQFQSDPSFNVGASPPINPLVREKRNRGIKSTSKKGKYTTTSNSAVSLRITNTCFKKIFNFKKIGSGYFSLVLFLIFSIYIEKIQLNQLIFSVLWTMCFLGWSFYCLTRNLNFYIELDGKKAHLD